MFYSDLNPLKKQVENSRTKKKIQQSDASRLISIKKAISLHHLIFRMISEENKTAVDDMRYQKSDRISTGFHD